MEKNFKKGDLFVAAWGFVTEPSVFRVYGVQNGLVYIDFIQAVPIERCTPYDEDLHKDLPRYD